MPAIDTSQRDGVTAVVPGWWQLVRRRSVVVRGLKFAVVVGAILIAINHGDDIVHGELTPVSYLKMGLTVVVPYVVSVFSSVGAILQQHRVPHPSEPPDPASR